MTAMPTQRALGLLLASALAAACGDPLAGQAFRGDPIWSTEVSVLSGTASGVDGGANLRLAFFFSPDPENLDPTTWTELLASSRPVATPSDDTLNVFEEPSPELLVRGADGGSLGYGLARLVIYDDENGDGRYQPGETLAAVQTAVTYLYAPAPVAAGAGPVDGAIPAGITLVSVPQACGAPPPGPTTPGDCGVPLGGRCFMPSDCPSGTCLLQTKLPWPSGYCTVEDTADTTCRPGDGVFFHAPEYAPIPDGVNGYWLRKCTQDQDCLRVGDPSLNYRCDVGLRGCVPLEGIPLTTGSQETGQLEPFCEGDVHPPPPPQP